MGYLPIGVFVPFITTILREESPDTVEVLSQIFEPRLVQLGTVVKPDMIGFAPVPYALNVIGLPNIPSLVGVIVPGNISPLRNNTLSPALRLLKKEFSLLRVFQGVAAFCAWAAVRLSSPVLEEK